MRSVHIPQYHFIIALIISDQHDWRDTRDKWPLAGNPDRSWWHRHTSLKLLCPQPMAPWTTDLRASYQVLPTRPNSLFTDLLHVSLGLPCWFHCKAFFYIAPSGFLKVWPIHFHLGFLISIWKGSWFVSFRRLWSRASECALRQP